MTGDAKTATQFLVSAAVVVFFARMFASDALEDFRVFPEQATVPIFVSVHAHRGFPVVIGINAETGRFAWDVTVAGVIDAEGAGFESHDGAVADAHAVLDALIEEGEV